MNRLLYHARQLNQRRMGVFYLLPHAAGAQPADAHGQLRLDHVPSHEDRPRTAREMFADVEYDNDDDLP